MVADNSNKEKDVNNELCSSTAHICVTPMSSNTDTTSNKEGVKNDGKSELRVESTDVENHHTKGALQLPPKDLMKDLESVKESSVVKCDNICHGINSKRLYNVLTKPSLVIELLQHFLMTQIFKSSRASRVLVFKLQTMIAAKVVVVPNTI